MSRKQKHPLDEDGVHGLGLAGMVLAGGRSSRMGCDKSLIRLGGRTLATLAAEKLRAVGCDPVYVMGPAKAYGLPAGITVVPDAQPGLGPLGGVYTGLSLCPAPSLVLSCDLPLVPVSLLRALRRSFRANDAALVCQSGFGIEPLVGIYSLNLVGMIEKRLMEGNHSLRGLLQCAGASYLRVLNETAFFNLNTPAQLRSLRRCTSRLPI